MSDQEGDLIHIDELICFDNDDTPVVFDPPLWQQRLELARQIIFSQEIDEVMDLGWGSGKLLLEILPSRSLKQVIGIDIDGPALESATRDCSPGFGDYHFRRPNPFNLTIFKGSILEQHPYLKFQPQLVTLIEVIEHIYAEYIPILSYTIFAYLNPDRVLISTPNRDFNINFPDPKKLRNSDHKFEWTRAEFKEYLDEVAEKYGYAYETTGVGTANGRLTNGYCTQVAILTRINKLSRRPAIKSAGTLKELAWYDFPVEEPINIEEKFTNELLYGYHTRIRFSYGDLEYGDYIALDQLMDERKLEPFEGYDIQKLIASALERDLHLAQDPESMHIALNVSQSSCSDEDYYEYDEDAEWGDFTSETEW